MTNIDIRQTKNIKHTHIIQNLYHIGSKKGKSRFKKLEKSKINLDSKQAQCDHLKSREITATAFDLVSYKICYSYLEVTGHLFR